MSLVVNALRICAVKALTGVTSVGDYVFDSVIDPRDLLSDEAMPVICVYADYGHRDVEGLDMFSPKEHTVYLSFEMSVARAVTVSAGENDEQVEFEFAATDGGQETFLRCLAYEVERALLSETPWASMFRRVAFRASPAENEKWKWDRGSSAENGRRFAILRSTLNIDVISEPVPGCPLTRIWSDLFELFAADDEVAQMGEYMRALIESPAVPSWRQAQRALGLTDEGVRALGIAPVDETETGEAALATEGVITDMDGLIEVHEPSEVEDS